jgi:hypothetical protein
MKNKGSKVKSLDILLIGNMKKLIVIFQNCHTSDIIKKKNLMIKKLF